MQVMEKIKMVQLEKEYENIIAQIDQLILKKGHIIIAIDGKCGSGKTTMAQFLKEYYHASLFKMDDFFLQKFQRTKERLMQPGGNVDYERFMHTVITPLLLKEDISYQRFDCSHMKLSDDIEIISYKPISIIEGTYSLHPYFKHYYDLSIVLDVSDEIQEKRILQREGKEKLKLFKSKWIPLENKYFSAFCIYENSDIIFGK